MEDLEFYKIMINDLDNIHPDLEIFEYSNVTDTEISHYIEGFNAAKDLFYELLYINYKKEKKFLIDFLSKLL